MRLWTWERLEQEFEKHQDAIQAFQDFPPKKECATFDDVLVIDNAQCIIVANLIGCQCVDSMQQQQAEVMEVRKTLWSSPREWIKAAEAYDAKDTSLEHAAPSRAITRRYSRKKQCHRNWHGPRAGLRCYCDVHKHGS